MVKIFIINEHPVAFYKEVGVQSIISTSIEGLSASKGVKYNSSAKAQDKKSSEFSFQNTLDKESKKLSSTQAEDIKIETENKEEFPEQQDHSPTKYVGEETPIEDHSDESIPTEEYFSTIGFVNPVQQNDIHNSKLFDDQFEQLVIDQKIAGVSIGGQLSNDETISGDDISKNGSVEEDLLTGVSLKEVDTELKSFDSMGKSAAYQEVEKQQSPNSVSSTKNTAILQQFKDAIIAQEAERQFKPISKIEEEQDFQFGTVDKSIDAEKMKAIQAYQGLSEKIESDVKDLPKVNSEVNPNFEKMLKGKSIAHEKFALTGEEDIESLNTGAEQSVQHFRKLDNISEDSSQIKDYIKNTKVKLKNITEGLNNNILLDRHEKVASVDLGGNSFQETLVNSSQESLDTGDALGKMSMMLSKNKEEMTIKLSPESLGEMKVKFMKDVDGVMQAKLVVETDQAKKLVESQLFPEMKRSLEEQGIKIQEMHVEVKDSNQNGTAFAFTEGDGKNGSNGQQKQANDVSSSNLDTSLNGISEVENSHINRQSESGVSLYA